MRCIALTADSLPQNPKPLPQNRTPSPPEPKSFRPAASFSMPRKQQQHNVNKKKLILPPDLPPEVSEDEIEVSDEDMDFIPQNQDYAALLSSLDSKSLNKYVNRVADSKEDELEALYEKKRLKKSLLEAKTEKTGIDVEPSNALPIKNFDGTLQYITVDRSTKQPEAETDQNESAAGADDNIVKLSKAEKRAKLKKSKREAKKQGKEHEENETNNSQADVLVI